MKELLTAAAIVILPCTLLDAVPAAAQTHTPTQNETQLDRAADICRAHRKPSFPSWNLDSTYDDSRYDADCRQVYMLWNTKGTRSNLEIIKRALSDPEKPTEGDLR